MNDNSKDLTVLSLIKGKVYLLKLTVEKSGSLALSLLKAKCVEK